MRRSDIRNLHDTITRLSALRDRFPLPDAVGDDLLSPLQDFGSNPGELIAKTYVPSSFRRGGALVVVLHGCTQTASGYDRSAGWSAAAEKHGFALLFPEQQRANNPNLCFNWFSPDDASRNRGEPLSIRQMVAAMQAGHGIDAERVFVTGLSAGGAMALVMLATYPEVFAGGAIIAGLPFGAARSVAEAFDRMRGHGIPASHALAQRVRSASSHAGDWPTLSVWHGSADSTVDLSNAAAIVDQWRILHGAPTAPSRIDKVDGYPHRVWRDAEGRDVIEDYTITGMAHGTPLSPSGSQGSENPGPYMLDVGISSTSHIVRFWGLADQLDEAARDDDVLLDRHSPSTSPHAWPAPSAPVAEPVRQPAGVQQAIEDALRAAGLLR